MAEFAVIVPVLLFLFMAIADFARLYTTMLTIESAAREAADYGTQYPWQWDATAPANNRAKTEAGMKERACAASSNLREYQGPDSNCLNPTFRYALEAPAGVQDCHAVPRADTPCNVVVTLTYQFDLILPVSIPFVGGSLGLPSTLTFDRTSIFAVSDFQIDAPLAPTPPPAPTPTP